MKKQRLIRTFRNANRLMLYYEPELFKDDVILSIHISATDADGIVYLDEHELEPIDWNTSYTYSASTSGEVPIDELGIKISSIPEKASINGKQRLKIGDESTYNINVPDDVDVSWQAEGSIQLIQTSDNQATIKSIEIGKGRLFATLTKTGCLDCCERKITINIESGLEKRDFAIIRNRYNF